MPNVIKRRTLSTSGVSVAQDILGEMTAAPTATNVVITFATTVTGTATYTLYYSYIGGAGSNPPAIASITRWLPVSDMTDAIVSVDSQFNRQITALKLDQTAGSGSVVLDVVIEFQS